MHKYVCDICAEANRWIKTYNTNGRNQIISMLLLLFFVCKLYLFWNFMRYVAHLSSMQRATHTHYTLSTHVVHSFRANKSLKYAIIISIAYIFESIVARFFVAYHYLLLVLFFTSSVSDLLVSGRHCVWCLSIPCFHTHTHTLNDFTFLL